jgi:iron(III) transport system permease protein
MAAKDLGAPDASVLWGILVPNLRSAFGVSLINGFTGSMMAYAAVLFLIVPGHKTAIFELFDALSGGKYGEAAMISLALVAITSLVSAAFGRLLVKRRS